MNIFKILQDLENNNENELELLLSFYNNSVKKPFLSDSEFILLTNEICLELKNFNVSNPLDLFHDFNIINSVNNFVLKIGIDKLVKLYEIYDYLLMDLDLFIKLSKILICYLNINKEEYKNCNEKFKNILNKIYQNEVIKEIYIYTEYNENIYIINEYNKLKNTNYEKRILTSEEKKFIKKKIDDYDQHYDYAAYNDDDSEYNDDDSEYNDDDNESEEDIIHDEQVDENYYNFTSVDFDDKIEKLINTFCNESAYNNKFPILNKHEYDIFDKLVTIFDYYLIKNSYSNIVNSYKLNEININDNNLDYLLILTNNFYPNEFYEIWNNEQHLLEKDEENLLEKDEETDICSRTLHYVELAGMCNNIQLINKIIKYYKLEEIEYNIFVDKTFYQPHIYKYLFKIKFYKKPLDFGSKLMNIIAYGGQDIYFSGNPQTTVYYTYYNSKLEENNNKQPRLL
jgi:hypothetical protein